MAREAPGCRSRSGDARMNGSAMRENHSRPRVGVPWRTSQEEEQANWPKLENYLNAVRAAGGEAVPISLEMDASDLGKLARTFDGIVLPGSPADVEPSRYGAPQHSETADADANRERTDYGLLDDAFAQKKPVLAICYLIQDIHSSVNTIVRHSKNDPPKTSEEPIHDARLESGSLVERLAGSACAQVNSSHHQAIERPAKGLRVTAYAPDRIIEAVEWTEGPHWVIGVQWHPERMFENRATQRLDEFSSKLFADLVAAARKVPAGAR